jgi:hypothetical protein
MTSRKGHPWELWNTVQESGTGESASPDSLTHGGWAADGKRAPSAQPPAPELLTKDTREKTTWQPPGSALRAVLDVLYPSLARSLQPEDSWWRPIARYVNQRQRRSASGGWQC